MRRIAFSFIILFFLLAAFEISPAFGGEVFFKLSSDAPIPEVLKKFEVKPAFQTIKDVYKVTVPDGYEDQDIEWLTENSDVEWAEENRKINIKLESTPNDPDYSKQWYIPWIHSDTLIWDDNELKSMDPVTIAVLDSGVDVDHEDLANNIWINSGEIPGNGLDDDGNGYEDDVYGYDWVNANLTQMEDEVGHGTHVAGIIGALINNNIGMAGILPKVKIMVLKIVESNGTIPVSETARIATAIDYAVANGAKVINMSFGTTTDSELVKTALASAYGNKVIEVAAAGNDGTKKKVYPAGYSWVIGVMAVEAAEDKDGNAINLLAGFSNYGSWYHLAAPGVGIYSTIPDNEYGFWSGTSMAAPVVSATAAALQYKHSDWSLELIRGQLYNTGDTVWYIDPLDKKLKVLPNSKALNTDGLFNSIPIPCIEMLGDPIIVEDDKDSDGELDGDENVDLAVTLFNTWGQAENVTATLSTSDIWVNITKAISNFSTISPYATDTNGEVPFEFHIDKDVPHHHIITFNLTVDFKDSESNDYQYTSSFSLSVSNVRELAGWIIADTTLEGGKYKLNANLIVPEGLTLTLKPGVFMEMNSFSIVVLGTIIASGTKGDMISFVEFYPSWQPNCIDDLNGQSVYSFCNFQNIQVHLDTSTLSHCIFDNLVGGVTALGASYDAESTLNSCQKCVIKNTRDYGKGIMVDSLVSFSMLSLNQYEFEKSTLWFWAANKSYGETQDCLENSNILGLDFISEARVMEENQLVNLGYTLEPTGFHLPNSGDDYIVVENQMFYSDDISLNNNFWGLRGNEEFEQNVGNPYPNISFFWDYYDLGAGEKNLYSPWLTEPVEDAPPAIWRVSVFQETAETNSISREADIVGAGDISIKVEYTGPMDASEQPSVRFGVAAPFNQHEFIGDWIDGKTWVGTYCADKLTGDGIQYVNITGGCDAEECWFTPPDFYYYSFEIDTGGIQSAELITNPGPTYLKASWIGVDTGQNPNFLGYKVYRKAGEAGSGETLAEKLENYTWISEALGYLGGTAYKDFEVQDGFQYSYIVTGVSKDLNEVEVGHVTVTYEAAEVSPSVTTTAVSEVTTTTAKTGGTVTSDGGAVITARGVCWGKSENPTTSSNKTTDGAETGIFTSDLTGLTANTTYHVRAYATNSAGLTGYGEDRIFVTDPLPPSEAYVNGTDATCNNNDPCYDSIQKAIDEASGATIINVSEGEYLESPTLTQAMEVTLKGGWNAQFTDQTGITKIYAPQTSGGGVVKIQPNTNIIPKP